ncbi:uncharacterized protein PHALS_12365 [Plasmopara halstedii]|uniref:Uncharacterized protein n=1 Tax=Plasmopara halstedii TaxID=4781 RepID=A0A0N7L5P6_PLAHL|nr:uncharacterized protein PHALS_12365 [Plasmopara halstedii]CEG42059.1 hypothetical protein PHALS_12365 [Plasmopara halstedii]|eukprot:XP_024578428.1 hypothetical protein PHALS_12365 [Plasmopara halstedii]
MAQGAPFSHEATYSSAGWLESDPTERDSPQREAVDAQSAPSSLGFPQSGGQPPTDARQNADDAGLCLLKLDEHRESPDGDRPSRHRSPPNLLKENGGVHYHVERLVSQRRRQN